MKNTPLVLLFTLSTLVGTGLTEAATVLNIDFNTTGSNTETGFSAFNLGANSTNLVNGLQNIYAVPTGATGGGAGNVTVTLNGRDASGNLATFPNGNFARLRGTPLDSGSFNYGDLYYDLLMGPVNSTSSAEVVLSGLAANTTFSLRVFSFDSQASSSTFTYTDHTSGSSVPFGAITTSGTPTSNLQNSFMGTITSSPTGTISFWAQATAGGSNGRAVINGFELDTVAVPEPSVTLSMLAGVVLLSFRRFPRRSNRSTLIA